MWSGPTFGRRLTTWDPICQALSKLKLWRRMSRNFTFLAAFFALGCVANRADSALTPQSRPHAAAFCPSISMVEGRSKRGLVSEPGALCGHQAVHDARRGSSSIGTSLRKSSPGAGRTAGRSRTFSLTMRSDALFLHTMHAILPSSTIRISTISSRRLSRTTLPFYSDSFARTVSSRVAATARRRRTR